MVKPVLPVIYLCTFNATRPKMIGVIKKFLLNKSIFEIKICEIKIFDLGFMQWLQ